MDAAQSGQSAAGASRRIRLPTPRPIGYILTPENRQFPSPGFVMRFLASQSVASHRLVDDRRCLQRRAQAQTVRQFAQVPALMVESEVASSGVKQPAILAAMCEVPRHEFVPADLRAYAYYDMALPIGDHQTISPPFVVASMTQQLDPKPTDRVLEIGTGSGYQAATSGALAVRGLYDRNRAGRWAETPARHFKKLGYKNIHAKLGDGYQGWAEARAVRQDHRHLLARKSSPARSSNNCAKEVASSCRSASAINKRSTR